MADYIAEREDWDGRPVHPGQHVDSESIGGHRFTVADFAEPARNMIDVVSAAHPE